MPLGLETQTDLSRGDWNQYSSSVYSEGCLDKKGEGLVEDEVTVKVEGDISPTWNADSHLGYRLSQGSDFLDYRETQVQGGGATSGNSKEKRFLCMFCSKGFSCPQKVEIHQRVHTGEKPFSCTQCHICFAQAGDLKRHHRVHTGEKPYNCPQCEKRFSRQHHLKMHLKVHAGERPLTSSRSRSRSTFSTFSFA
uniref:C2H2-type domain-containing protein n=1 Tax=Hucho hucho TaxID=62062 RepID=A0A4W5NIP9_9TELE